MHAKRAITIVLLLSTGLVPPVPAAASAGAEPPAHGAVSETGRLVVGLSGPHGLGVGDRYLGLSVETVDERLHFLVVSPTDPLAFRAQAQADPRVRYVEPERRIPLLDAWPDDPRFGAQYAPMNVGAPAAWALFPGDGSSAVCVVDTGLRATHEEFAGRFLGGYNYVGYNTDVSDGMGHGTHVAGIAAATVGNGLGIAGMGNVGLYAVKAGSDRYILTTAAASGIAWCANAPVERTVINLSFGCQSCDDRAISDAIEYAVQTKGRIVVAGAGNDGCQDCVLHPARHPDAIAVGCTTRARGLCPFSARGPQVEVSAPGFSVLSTLHVSDLAYGRMSGTSMSAPHVAGALALAWGHLPHLTGPQLRARLAATAHDLGAPGRDDGFGHGELDVGCLLSGAQPCPRPPEAACGWAPNDCFADARLVDGVPFSDRRGTAGAGAEPGEPRACAKGGGPVGSTVWYALAVDEDVDLVADTTGSDFDTVLAVYRGSALSDLALLACNDDAPGALSSRAWFPARAGERYYVQASGVGEDFGDLAFRVRPIAPPAPCPEASVPADCFAAATELRGVPATHRRDTRGATLEPEEPRPCGGMGATVWYRWTAESDGFVEIDTRESGFDTVLAVYAGRWGALEPLACNDDAAPGVLQSRVRLDVQAGNAYFVQAGGSLGRQGDLAIRFGGCPGVRGDCFAQAEAVTSTPYVDVRDTGGATNEPGEPAGCASSIGASLWYRWEPARSGRAAATTLGSSYDTMLAAYRGDDLAALSLVACNNDLAPKIAQSRLDFPVEAGTTYFVQVAGPHGASGRLVLTLAVA